MTKTDEPATVDGPLATSRGDADDIALVHCEDARRWTRGDLLARAERVVRSLREQGVRPGERVAICCAERSSTLVALLAVSGSTIAAPLGPDGSEEDFASTFVRLRIAVVLSDRPTPQLLAAAAAAGVALLQYPDESADAVGSRGAIADDASASASAGVDDAGASVDGAGVDAVSVDAAADTLVYRRARAADEVVLLLQTSGTTGEPKVVPLRHGQIVASATNIAATLQLSPDDLGLAVMPLFHIHGIMASLFAPLLADSPILLADPVDPSRFPDWLTRHRPTWYSAVPTLHQAFLTAWEARPERRARSSLRLIRSSSAPLPARLHDALGERFGAPLIEAYGMTEACHQIASGAAADGERRRGSVGRARGVELRIVGVEDRAPLGSGQCGEILLRGATVSPPRPATDSPAAGARLDAPGAGPVAGSAGGPEANPDDGPWASSGDGPGADSGDGPEAGPDDGHGWFATGDLGFLDADGFLFLDGRIKELVNRGGEKVNPLEVDRVLASHPALAEALSFGVPHPTLGEDLHAAVVVRAGEHVDEAALREHCFAHLADSKVPSHVVVLAALPRSPSGKLVRSTVASAAARTSADDAALPETVLERYVAGFFVDVLSLNQARATDNFFSLGGDSLSAMRVATRVGETLLVDVSPVALFRHPTVRGYARELDRLSAEVFDRPLGELLVELDG